jgi:hypothetical protein
MTATPPCYRHPRGVWMAACRRPPAAGRLTSPLPRLLRLSHPAGAAPTLGTNMITTVHNLESVLVLDFVTACSELAEARLERSRKDTPGNRVHPGTPAVRKSRRPAAARTWDRVTVRPVAATLSDRAGIRAAARVRRRDRSGAKEDG